MATALRATYSPPSPLELHYADVNSSIYPDRPIRPLPKRRLRSRLSSEVVDSILYPAAASSSKSLFQFPYKESANHVTGTSRGHILEDGLCLDEEDRNGDETENDSYQFRGNEVGSDEENDVGAIQRYQGQRRKSGVVVPNSTRNDYTVARTDASKFIKPPIPQSTASSGDSVDGYESFENTNNKKKRKIPTSGSLGNHSSTLSAEMAQIGISSARDIDVSLGESDIGVGQYYGTGSSALPAAVSGNGLSGAGRGRYGRIGTRHHDGRRSLTVSTNGSSTLQPGRLPYHRKDYASSGSLGGRDAVLTKASDQGIISAAIANAAAPPASLANGREHLNLLEQQSTKRASSTKTQFTFTCESDAAKSMVWPDLHGPLNGGPYQAMPPNGGIQPSHNSRGFATQGTQTSPNMAGQVGQTASQQPDSQNAQQQPKKPRRSLKKQYAIAARDRRLRQELENYKQRPKEDEIWICEFCEYESIFGKPPAALIGQYEAKDRRDRKRQAEKRRLLEKAKMKGRKGKKGNKNAAKNGSATTQVQQSTQKQRHDQQPTDPAPLHHQGTQGEEPMVDDDADPTPVAAQPAQTPSKIPQPVTHNHNQSLRPPSGTGLARTAGHAGLAA